MANYQLMRTIIPLSGQCEWAIDIDKNALSNFRIKPISEYINFNDDRNCILYSHQDNLKHLYESTSATFFESVLKPELRGWAPILTDHQIDTHESTYEYGCERVSFSKYNKTFKMLIPIWLDDLKDVYNINIQLIGSSAKNHRTTNKNINDFDDTIKDGLTVDPAVALFRFGFNLNRYDRSDTLEGKLSRYFWDWIDYINPNKEYDNFLYMSFAKQNANIAGVDCASGTPIVKSVNSLINNLTYRERPLMEQNHLMTMQWADNKMICNQLFNFALYFNIDDLTDMNLDMSPLNFTSEIYITRQDVVNEVLVNDASLSDSISDSPTYTTNRQLLEQSDFLFNYDFIRKTHIEYIKYKGTYIFGAPDVVKSQGIKELMTNTSAKTENVFDYMSDNKFIDFMKSNKLVPVDVFMKQINQSSPFVLYDGFAPVVTTFTTSKNKDDENTTEYASAVNDVETNIIDDVWTPLNNTDKWLKWVICANTLSYVATTDYKYRSQEFDPTSGYGSIFEWQGIKLYKSKFSSEFIKDHPYKYMYGIMEKYCDDTKENILTGSKDNNKYNVCPYSFIIGGDTIGVCVYIGPNSVIYKENCSGDDIMSLLTFVKFKEFINVVYEAMNSDDESLININSVQVSDNNTIITQYIKIEAKTIKKLFKEQINAIEFLHTLVNATIPATVIFYNKTISPTEIERPLFANEISYNKVNNYYKYLIRYDGKMTPFFFNDSSRYYNMIYQFKKMYDIEQSDYYKNITSKFTPIYPSVEYYPLDKLALKFTNTDYIDIDNAKKNDNKNDISYISDTDTCYYNFYPRHINERNFSFDKRFDDNLGEIKWYNDSLVYVLPKAVELEIPYKKEILMLESTNEQVVNNYGENVNVEMLTNKKVMVDNVPDRSHLAEYFIKCLSYSKGLYFGKLDYSTNTLTKDDIKMIVENYIIDKYDFTYVIQETESLTEKVIIYKVLYTLK